MKVDSNTFIHDILARIEKHPAGFIFIAFSGPSEAASLIKRVRIRPLSIKESLHYQVESFTQTQSFSINVPPNELKRELAKAFSHFTQSLIRFIGEEVHAHAQDGHISYKTTSHKKVFLQDLSHNRPKNYELPEKQPSDVLIALGIQSKEGKVLRDKFDKFKQINRFLEIVNDIRPELSEHPHVIDFGCGKAYLTFALYNMLEDATIIGIDARADVIEKCEVLKAAIKAKNLHFKQMRIEDYTHKGPVDMVIALHACDTATDAALAKAINLQAEVILVAPCCQHEVAKQIKKESSPLLLQHGLIKERFSALVTDALRAEILNQLGYSVDLIEFVDPEHTPKNLLIRATRKKHTAPPDWTAYKALKQNLGITLTLERLLGLEEASP